MAAGSPVSPRVFSVQHGATLALATQVGAPRRSRVMEKDGGGMQPSLTSFPGKTTIRPIKWVHGHHARSLLQPTGIEGGLCSPLNIPDLGVCSCTETSCDTDAWARAIPRLHGGHIPGGIAQIMGKQGEVRAAGQLLLHVSCAMGLGLFSSACAGEREPTEVYND